MHCPNCGELISDRSKFCEHCGSKSVSSSNGKIRTISELNGKWWYRFIKVFYILALITFCIGAAAGLYATNRPKQEFDNAASYVQCDDGRKLGLEENSVYLYSDYMPTYQQQDFRKSCAYNPSDPININPDNASDIQRLNPSINNFKLISIYKTEGLLSEAIGYSLLAIIVILIIFEIVRRVFYYIILGRINPAK